MKKLLVLCVLAFAACDSSSDPQVDANLQTDSDGGLGPDAPLDADDRCDACGPNQICVQKFNGTCGEFGLECQDRAPGCTGNNCNECNVPHCTDGLDAGFLTCFAAGCPGEIPEALHCYGP